MVTFSLFERVMTMTRLFTRQGAFLPAVLTTVGLHVGFVAVQAKCPDNRPATALCATTEDSQCTGSLKKVCRQDRFLVEKFSGAFSTESFSGTQSVVDPDSSVDCYSYYRCKWNSLMMRCEVNRVKLHVHQSNELKSVDC